MRERLAAAKPDVVFVGLGFPKQERVIAALAPGLPRPGFWAAGRPSRSRPGGPPGPAVDAAQRARMGGGCSASRAGWPGGT